MYLAVEAIEIMQRNNKVSSQPQCEAWRRKLPKNHFSLNINKLTWSGTFKHTFHRSKAAARHKEET